MGHLNIAFYNGDQNLPHFNWKFKNTFINFDKEAQPEIKLFYTQA